MSEMLIDFEQRVIAKMLMTPDFIVDVFDTLSVNDFAVEQHRKIVNIIVGLQSENKPVDLFSVAEALGDLSYVTDLATNATIANVDAAINYIYLQSTKRKALANLSAATEAIVNAKTVEDQIEALSGVGEGIDTAGDDFLTYGEQVKNALSALDRRMQGVEPEGLQTGFGSIDERLGGLVDGNLIIVAGRPAMGKTTYAMNIAENAADSGNNVLVFSLEMGSEELINRQISSASGIHAGVIKKPKPVGEMGGLNVGEQQKLVVGAGKMKNRNMTIIDKAMLEVNHLSNIAKKFNRKKKVDLIVIDYLQLITAKAEGRFQEISMISRCLKALAKEIGAPVIALSQLSRGVEQRQDKRPMLSDLRESGQIEQDADIIQFLYRDEYYVKESQNKGLAEVITAKFRDGEIGTDYLESQLHMNRFVSTNRTHIEPEAKGGKYASYSYNS